MIPAGCVAACPGCKHRELSVGASLMQKQAWAEQNFPGAPVFPIISPVKRWRYRRKSVLHARHMEDVWAFGLVKRVGREEEFVPIPNCPLHDPYVNQAYAALRDLPSWLPLVFAAVTGRALTLVLKEKRSERSLEALRGIASDSVWVNWNPSAGRRVFSSAHMELVSGSEWLCDEGIWHGPTGFRQQIPEMEDRAQEMAFDFLGAASQVVDLYSGLGLSLRRWKSGVGVELGGESVAAALRNAPGKEILRGRVEQRLPHLPASGFSVYTNPPRTGHAPEVNDWILRTRPERIAYLSCNMKSLARDLGALASSYQVLRVQPFDFFPQTDHVEALAFLRRLK